jgi:hypothetical protein
VTENTAVYVMSKLHLLNASGGGVGYYLKRFRLWDDRACRAVPLD